jgi:hypothetical protein
MRGKSKSTPEPVWRRLTRHKPAAPHRRDPLNVLEAKDGRSFLGMSPRVQVMSRE